MKCSPRKIIKKLAKKSKVNNFRSLEINQWNKTNWKRLEDSIVWHFNLGLSPFPFKFPSYLISMVQQLWKTSSLVASKEYKRLLDLNYKNHLVTVNISSKLHCPGGIWHDSELGGGGGGAGRTAYPWGITETIAITLQHHSHLRLYFSCGKQEPALYQTHWKKAVMNQMGPRGL